MAVWAAWRIALARHTLGDLMFMKFLTEKVTGILTTLVGVKDQTLEAGFGLASTTC